MKGPGYMAVVAGEVVHIVKCIPVEVLVKHGDSCYSELMVSRENSTYFLSPRTHILKSKGTQIPCNTLLPSYYFIGDIWYKILPQPVESKNPMVMKPLTRPTWRYQSPAHLATSGIYSQKDLQDLKDRIMFPVERDAVLNDFAREVNGLPPADQQGTLLKLLNEDAVSRIIESTWQRTWNRFLTFGTASAGFIGLLIIIKGIKIIVDVLVRGYTLHSAFGWSYYLLGAIWSSVSHLLLYLSQGPSSSTPSAPTPPNDRDVEASIPIQSNVPQSSNNPQATSVPQCGHNPRNPIVQHHSEVQNNSSQQINSTQNAVEITNNKVSYFSYPDLN